MQAIGLFLDAVAHLGTGSDSEKPKSSQDDDSIYTDLPIIEDGLVHVVRMRIEQPYVHTRSSPIEYLAPLPDPEKMTRPRDSY